jgi:hypothetical protein
VDLPAWGVSKSFHELIYRARYIKQEIKCKCSNPTDYSTGKVIFGTVKTVVASRMAKIRADLHDGILDRIHANTAIQGLLWGKSVQ